VVEPKDEKRVTVRMSPEMYEMMVASARERNLSINAFIIRAIENSEFDKALERRMVEIEAFIEELKAKQATDN
jgi:uncharacterized protein (DUF1778 family)